MSDQAADLREIVQSGRPMSAGPGRARVVAITSGKGGVGKTNLCVNLALALAERGQRVILFDADLGLANVDIVMGIAPEWNLSHLVRGQRTVHEILAEGPGGVRIVPSGSGIRDMADLPPPARARVLEGLGELESLADWLLVDTGAGLSENVLAFLKASDEVLVVTTPEPTALLDAYGVIKSFSAERPKAIVRVVVNQATDEDDAAQVHERLRAAAAQFLHFPILPLGFVVRDAAVSQAVIRQKPLLIAYPQSQAARCIRAVAAALGGEPRGGGETGFFRRLSGLLRA